MCFLANDICFLYSQVHRILILYRCNANKQEKKRKKRKVAKHISTEQISIIKAIDLVVDITLKVMPPRKRHKVPPYTN